ncbi:GAF and ANTAR domain-containing protein [Kocuria sp. U4B]
MAELTAVFARIQGMLLSQHDATDAVQQLAQVARDLIDTAVGAGVSLLEAEGAKITTAATDAVVEAADAAQYELGEGPCLSAWATGVAQRIEDTATDTYWPRWSAAAARLGVSSVLSTPLVFRGETMGALKIYATTAGAFTVTDERMVGLLAGAAATLLGAGQDPQAPRRLSAALQAALGERQAMDMATGLLMARRHLGAEDARRWLLETAAADHRPAPELARELLEAAEDPIGGDLLPSDPTPSDPRRSGPAGHGP